MNHVQHDFIHFHFHSFIFSKIIHWNNLANQQFLKLQLRPSLSTFIDIPILFSSPFLEFTIALQPLSRFNSFRAGPRLETRLNGHRCNVNRTRGDGNWINVSVRERSRVETSAKGYRNLFSKDEDQVAEEKIERNRFHSAIYLKLHLFFHAVGNGVTGLSSRVARFLV